MVVAHQAHRLGVADVVGQLNAGTRIVEAKTPALQNAPVTFGVQLGETTAELEGLVTDGDGTVGAQPLPHRLLGQRVGIDAQEMRMTKNDEL